MSPRHAPEIRFRPHKVNVRRNESGAVTLVKVSGNRLPPRGGLPMPGTLDSWDWDSERDPEPERLRNLLEELDR